MDENHVRYLKEFDKYCQEWDCFLNSGNHKKANLCYSKIKKIYDKISNYDEKDIFYSDLLKNFTNPRTLTTACTQMLILNVNVEEAVRILKKISFMDIKSSAVFSAKIALQEWNNGNLVKF